MANTRDWMNTGLNSSVSYIYLFKILLSCLSPQRQSSIFQQPKDDNCLWLMCTNGKKEPNSCSEDTAKHNIYIQGLARTFFQDWNRLLQFSSEQPGRYSRSQRNSAKASGRKLPLTLPPFPRAIQKATRKTDGGVF